MTSTINATTGGLQISNDDSAILALGTNGNPGITLDGSQVATLSKYLGFADGSFLASGNSLGLRNRIINGDCKINQRGYGSTAITSSAIYTGYDRYIYLDTTGSTTVSQSTISIGGLTYDCNTTNITTVPTFVSSSVIEGCSQLIEGYNCYDLLGWPVTVSFLFETNLAGTYSVALRDQNGKNSCVKSFTAIAGSQLVSITFPPLPTGLNVPLNVSYGLQLDIAAIGGSNFITPTEGAWVSGNFVYTSSSTNWSATLNNYIAATLIQVEKGPVATPFEFRPSAVEMMLCQRYYWAGDVYLQGYQIASSRIKGVVPNFGTMAGIPTGAVITASQSNSNSDPLFETSTTGSFLSVSAAATGSLYYNAQVSLDAELT